jgi:hypothetical protein
MATAKAWLTLELRPSRMGMFDVKIVGVRQSRPLNQMAVFVRLDIGEDVLMPSAQALVEAGQIVLEIEDQEPEDEDGR